MSREKKAIFHMPRALRKALGGDDEAETFAKAMALQGKPFRDVPGRKTSQVNLLGKSYFIKQHFGVGWKEIFKNLVTFKRPVLGAMTEVYAIEKMASLGIATTPLVAYGQQGEDPANIQSFVLTQDLGDIISLEDLCERWKETPPDPKFKRELIVAVAEIARTIHEAGVNHRDFYLCHFCIDNACVDNALLGQQGAGNKHASGNKRANHIRLYLIDLHRVLIHDTPSFKANMKDVAGLYFSSLDVGLTTRDYLRFKRHYQKQTPAFWQQVEKRAQALYIKFYSRKSQEKLAIERSRIS